MNSSVKDILAEIDSYKRKFHKNQLIKGILLGLGLLLAAFLFINFLEYFGRFGSVFRLILLVTFVGVCIFVLGKYILKPSFYLLNINAAFTDENAAQQIGEFFPNIKDKLLNTIQLSKLSYEENSLLAASIAQKTGELKFVKFTDAINLGENRKYIKYALPPIILALLLSAFAPSFFRSTERIVKFNKTFAEPAPFNFNVLNKNLNGIKNEDFILNLSLSGNSQPDEVYLVSNDRRYKMNFVDGKFSHTFANIQENTDFHFEAGGFNSSDYRINLISRPNLISFNVALKYPAYLGKQNEEFDNVGNLVVPEGTVLKWVFKTNDTDDFELVFDSSNVVKVEKGLFTDFNFERKVNKDISYEIKLSNKNSNNANPINYFINVIPDKYPQINFEQISDSSLYNYIGIGGTISDDYGISDFQFAYKTKEDKTFKFVKIPFNKVSISQSFFYQVDINTLGLKQNQQLEYFLMVTDNDGVNGRKSTKSAVLHFNMPSTEEYSQDVDKEVNKSEDKFEELIKKSKEFKKELNALEDNLKKKKQLDFQDEKDLEKLIEKKEDLNKELQSLKDQLQSLLEKQNRFEPQNQKTIEKMQMLQKLIDEIMQNEDSKIMKELKEMLENQLDDKSLNELEKFNKKQRNLDKELDRSLNLFKEMQRKQEIEKMAKELNDLAEKQEKLAEKTENEKSKNLDALEKEQEKLNEEFKEKRKELDELEKKSEEQDKNFDKKEELQKDVSDEQNNAKSELKKNQKGSAAKSQKNAAKKMKQMAQEMEQEMQSQEMQQTQMDMNSLRTILENLIKISFDQEKIMKDFRGISVSDPRFVTLSQQQLNISDDSKIIEDSLYSLASRVMQLEATVTKEVTDMKNTIDESVKLIRERKLPEASSKQQYSMTSMNNLALLLSDTFKQMQQMMSPGSGSGEGDSEGGDLGEKQGKLNQRLQGIGTGGKTPKEVSEEIAKIVNEQAAIRKQLKNLQDKLNGTEAEKKLGDELENIQKDMDKSEEDLVNKRLTPELQKRQKQIEMRLLEAEKGIKEQELDPTRKSNTGIQFNKVSPPELEKFKKEKNKQVELLRTTPPNFTPFYKNQTDNYFKRIK